MQFLSPFDSKVAKERKSAALRRPGLHSTDGHRAVVKWVKPAASSGTRGRLTTWTPSCFLIIKIQVWSLSNGKTSSYTSAGTNVLANGREKMAAQRQQNPAVTATQASFCSIWVWRMVIFFSFIDILFVFKLLSSTFKFFKWSRFLPSCVIP